MQLHSRVFALLLLTGCLPRVFAQQAVTIVNNGDPANRIDLVILGDGYTTAELGKFNTDAQQLVARMFGQEPFKEYARYFNVHRIDIASAESGADHPERNPPVAKNTAFDATYNCANTQRLICINTSKVLEAVSSALSPVARDVLLVLVNDPEYGGSGGSVAVASTHPDVVELVLHELGHSMAQLADEYAGGGVCNSATEPPNVNSTSQTARESIKWKHWIEPSTAIPTLTTTPATPGLYEGSSYCDKGLYRPTYNSKMRSLGQPFEQINAEHLVRRFYNLVSPLDTSQPSTNQLTLVRGTKQVFTVSVLVPQSHNLSVAWRVDGQKQAEGSAFTVDTAGLALGSHTVETEIIDTTSMVRSDPTALLTERRSWTITIVAAGNLTALFTQIATGSGYSTVFSLTNTGTIPFAGRLVLTDKEGNAFSVRMSGDLNPSASPGSLFDIAIPIGGSKTFTATVLNPGDNLRTGWGQVESLSGTVSGSATFQLEELGRLVTVAGVLASQPIQFATIPVDNDEDESRFTGFAIANPGDEDVLVRITIVGENGNVVETVSPPEINPLRKRRQISVFLHQLVTGKTRFRGSMVIAVQGGKKCGVVALILARGLLSVIPVISEKSPTLPE
jgi:hypothetical protein